MSFTLVQSASTSTITGSTSMAVTLASAVTAGHLLVAVVELFGGANTPTITHIQDTSGNGSGGNYILPSGGQVSNTTNKTLSAVYYAFNVAAASAGTLTITLTGTNISAFCQLTVCEFSSTGGSFTTDPIDTANTSTQNNGGTTQTPTVTLTTSGASRLVVGGAIGDNGQTAAGTIAGVAATLISNTGGNGDVSEWGTSGAGTSVVCTTGPADDGWDMAFAAFIQPGGSGGGGTVYPFGMWFQ